MLKEKIIDLSSNEEIYRNYTALEIAEVEAAQAEAVKKAEAELEARAKRLSALAKLEALGLDEDDLKALGL